MKKMGKNSESVYSVYAVYMVVTVTLAWLLMFGTGFAEEMKSSETESQAGSSGQQVQPHSQQSGTPQGAQEQSAQSGSQKNLENYRPFVGREVRSQNGEEIGEIENVLVSEDGKQVKAVLGVGGFLGMGEKKVLISLNELRFDPKADHVVYGGTEQDLKNRAEYKEPGERREYARRPIDRPGYHGYPPYGYERDRRDYPPSGRYFRDYEDRYGRRDLGDDDRYGRGYYDDRYGRGYYEEGRDRYPAREERSGREADRRYREERSFRDDRYGRGYEGQRRENW